MGGWGRAAGADRNRSPSEIDRMTASTALASPSHLRSRSLNDSNWPNGAAGACEEAGERRSPRRPLSVEPIGIPIDHPLSLLSSSPLASSSEFEYECVVGVAARRCGGRRCCFCWMAEGGRWRTRRSIGVIVCASVWRVLVWRAACGRAL